jgi:glutaconyl-CoA decarboxylase
VPAAHPLQPGDNEEGTTNVIDGLGKISGKWAVIIGFDNKVMAGAWLAGPVREHPAGHRPGQAPQPAPGLAGELQRRQAHRAGKILRQPPRRRHPFFRHAELEQMGIPVLAGIYGTNPAGGGYQGISPTVLFAHKNCNIAVGGAGIVSGMAPKGQISTWRWPEQLIEKAKAFQGQAPGTCQVHHTTRPVSSAMSTKKEKGAGRPQGLHEGHARPMTPKFFRVAEPQEPRLTRRRMYRLLPMAPKKVYDFDRSGPPGGRQRAHGVPPGLRPGGLHRPVQESTVFLWPHRQPPGYTWAKDYPEYADYPGIGGKLYRQGLIKMNEFVTLCGRDRIPVIWFQDTTGIDVGDPPKRPSCWAWASP